MNHITVNLLLPPQLWLDLNLAAAKEGQTRADFIRVKLQAAAHGDERQKRRAEPVPAAWPNVAPLRAVEVEPEPEPEVQGPMWTNGTLTVPHSSQMSPAYRAEFERLWKDWRKQFPSAPHMERWPWVAERLAQFEEPEDDAAWDREHHADLR